MYAGGSWLAKISILRGLRFLSSPFFGWGTALFTIYRRLPVSDGMQAREVESFLHFAPGISLPPPPPHFVLLSVLITAMFEIHDIFGRKPSYRRASPHESERIYISFR